MALKRFTARRGRPQRIYSDNGINFLGANNELLKRLNQLNEQRKTRSLYCKTGSLLKKRLELLWWKQKVY